MIPFTAKSLDGQNPSAQALSPSLHCASKVASTTTPAPWEGILRMPRKNTLGREPKEHCPLPPVPFTPAI